MCSKRITQPQDSAFSLNEYSDYCILMLSPSKNIQPVSIGPTQEKMIVLEPFLADIASQYILDPHGMHGLAHWGRVMENGLRLAQVEEGDVVVICLFAIFHDACRHNQTLDPGHGARGAVLAEQLLGDLTLVSKEQLDQLILACRKHTDGTTTADLTVQICWDSDRLDLARASIQPNPKYLCTKTAKSEEIIRWANQRSTSNFSPLFVQRDWEPIFTKR